MCTTSENGDGEGDSSPSSSSKKPKRVPKRGPGVAELEKILREQEKCNTNSKTHLLQTQFSPFISSSSSSLVVVDHYLQQPHHQRYFPIPINNNTSTSTSNSCYNIKDTDNNNNNNNNMFLPEMKTNYTEGFVSPTTNQIPVNFSSQSVGLWHPIEPPSSQRSCVVPQEHKFVGLKRPIPVENNRYQVQIPYKKQRHDIDNSTSLRFNFNLCKPMPVSTESKCDYLQSYDAEFISPNTHVMMPFQAVQHELPKYDLTPFQGNMREYLNQRSIGSDPSKPFFFTFLPPSSDQKVTKAATFDLNKIEKGNNKAGQDGIDLNLKLSTT